jgi:hypothetical protein
MMKRPIRSSLGSCSLVHLIVTAGLVPAIHLIGMAVPISVDARITSGHDD